MGQNALFPTFTESHHMVFFKFFWCGTVGTPSLVTSESFVKIRSAVWPPTGDRRHQLFEFSLVSPQTPHPIPCPPGGGQNYFFEGCLVGGR